ncbi:MAG: 2-amino-4-hydroxy-6-hydroxymethyldihydropteridine diphosphokinase [Nitrospiraceae bacterium]|nr:MAG: 2-amino-4-hydroxy-6-hydroxymethyldihydropteridine diphosphokinase [Nitrospiraceae bacterium]
MHTAYIGIGSNLGNRDDNCERAIRLLIENSVTVTKRSSMAETEPWGVREQPKFINMAVETETALSPQELLRLLKKIEEDVGRLPTSRWGPRIIDLDILLYDDLIMETPGLVVPHPNIAEREFVLKPLAEIAPEKIHPVLKKSIKDLYLQSPRNS